MSSAFVGLYLDGAVRCHGIASMFGVGTFGNIDEVVVVSASAVRPAISLLRTTMVSGGNGTSSNLFKNSWLISEEFNDKKLVEKRLY